MAFDISFEYLLPSVSPISLVDHEKVQYNTLFTIQITQLRNSLMLSTRQFVTSKSAPVLGSGMISSTCFDLVSPRHI